MSTKYLQPIVEFFPIRGSSGSDLFEDTTQPDQKRLRDVLQSATGIYAFYNSEAEIIYLGKTERRNLWKRMRESYRQEARYPRYYVEHPRDEFKSAPKVRKIVRRKVGIGEVATFCSAYSMSKELISFSEQLLVRLIPNDLINLRMEGNVSLRSFSPTAKSVRSKRSLTMPSKSIG